MRPDDSLFTRIGVFYDGQFFSHVSNYYLYRHERKARISVTGLHHFIMNAVHEAEGVDKDRCRIVDAHYFRGRLSAAEALERDSLYRERVWEDTLTRAGVVTHFLPLSPIGERGVDVWFALEAFELAMYKRFSVSVLITGDGDYVPLIRKLHTIGTRTMVLAWDFKYVDEMGRDRETRTNQLLLEEATYKLEMHTEIEARSRKKDPLITGLFVPHKEVPTKTISPADSPTVDSVEPRTGSIVTLQDGYGFVRPDGGGDNLFFHHSSLVDTDYAELSKGDEVSYVLGRNDKGPCALRVKKQDQATG